MQQNDYRPPLYSQKDAGILYSLVCIAPILLSTVYVLILHAFGVKSSADVNWQRYLAYFLPQLSFAVCIGVLCVWKKRKPDVRLKLAPARFWAIGLLLSVGTLFGLSQLNSWFVRGLEHIGLPQSPVVVPTMNGAGGYILSLLIIAVLPAVLEEVVFRGIVLEGLRTGGTVRAVLFSGLLFSLFHQNPVQTPYQFVCGCLFALLALRSGSITVPVVMHFINNAFILTAEFAGLRLPSLAITLPIGLCALVGGVLWLIFSGKNSTKTEKQKPFWFAALAGIIYSAIAWVVVLVA